MELKPVTSADMIPAAVKNEIDFMLGSYEEIVFLHPFITEIKTGRYARIESGNRYFIASYDNDFLLALYNKLVLAGFPILQILPDYINKFLCGSVIF